MAYSLETIKKDLLLTQPTFEQMNLNKVSFAQEMEFAVQAFTTNPALLNCNADTVKNCLVNIALSGLTLSPVMKMAHLVPRKGKCCVDVSYMGLIKIITDTGSVQSIKAKLVYENEPFEIELGSGCFVKHGIYKGNVNKGKRIGAYSIAVLNDGSDHIEWMYESELMEIKARAQKTGGAVWNSDENEMCRKTVVKRHWKYLPKSERSVLAAQAISFDDENNGIDFEQEAKDKARKANPASATPNAPTQDALATDEDYQTIYGILNTFLSLGVTFLNPNTPQAVSINAIGQKVQADQAAGRIMEKSVAEKYIKDLNAYLAPYLNQQQKP